MVPPTLTDRMLDMSAPLVEKGLQTQLGQRFLGNGILNYFKGEQPSRMMQFVLNNPRVRQVVLKSSADWMKKQDNRKHVVPHLGTFVKNKLNAFFSNAPKDPNAITMSEAVPYFFKNRVG